MNKTNNIIGYQLVSKDGENRQPEQMYSFEVFPEKYLLSNKLSWENEFNMVPVYEDTIENPTVYDYVEEELVIVEKDGVKY